MEYFLEVLAQGLRLVLVGDSSLLSALRVSLEVSLISTGLATVVALPFGISDRRVSILRKTIG